MLKTLEYNGVTYYLCKRTDVGNDNTEYYLLGNNIPDIGASKTVDKCYMFKSIQVGV